MRTIDTQGRLLIASEARTGYGTSTAITLSLAPGGTGLANNAARECTAIDNSSNNYLDAIVYLAIRFTGTPTADKAIYVWFYGSHDATNFTDNATGSNNNLTLRSPTNLRGPFVISTPDAGSPNPATDPITYKAVIGSVAAFFGGILPRAWGIVVQNKTGIAFDATETNHTKSYVGVYSKS